jgi:hypothetical protein
MATDSNYSAAVPPEIVTTIDAVTPAWLNQVLVERGRAPSVVAVESGRIGTGQIGDSYRLTLDHDPTALASASASAPASLVVKLPAADETSRGAGVATGNYEKEAWFYAELAGTVAIRTPRCWFSAAVGGTAEAVVLLEDLAPAEQGDQIAGCTAEQATLAVTELARLHGPRWNDPSLDTVTWLGRRTDESVANVQMLYDLLLPGFVARYGDRIGPDAVATVERLGGVLTPWLAGYDGPLTLTHGDYRLDNLLFASPAGGAPIAVVDWGGAGHGPGVADLAYFCGAGLLPAARREHEAALLERYRAELGSFGVDLGADWLWTEYRRGAFAGLLISVVASMIVRQDDRGDEMFVAMTTRHTEHVADMDAFALLR